MSILSNLFKKKEPILEDLGSSEPVRDLGMKPRALATDFEPVEEPKAYGSKEDLILAKLDMISIRLDNLDRRVQYIEKVARESEK